MATDTLKTTTEAYWGALGKLPALDAIFRACEQLEADEVPLNRDNVKDLSGITYTNLLATGLQLYRRRKTEFEAHTHTPSSILHLLAQSVEREFASLHYQFEQQLATWQADTDTLQEDAIQDLDHLRAQTLHQAEMLEEKDTQLEALIEEQHMLRQQLKAAEQREQEQAQRYQAALGEGAQSKEALTVAEHRRLAQEHEHQAQLDALKVEQRQLRQELIDQHDKETARLQTQLGNERGEWKQEREALKTASEQIRQQHEHTQADFLATKQTLLDAQRREEEGQQQWDQAQEDARHAFKEHQRALAALQEELDHTAKKVIQLETELQLAKQTDPVQLATQQKLQALLEQLQRSEAHKP